MVPERQRVTDRLLEAVYRAREAGLATQESLAEIERLCGQYDRDLYLLDLMNAELAPYGPAGESGEGRPRVIVRRAGEPDGERPWRSRAVS